jgi:hypothetical protein
MNCIMAHTCRTCSRINPAEARYCFHDGTALDGHGGQDGPVQAGALLFRHPFVFPSGVTCRTFDELALACQRDWDSAQEMLKQGYLERFLGGMGRGDLAIAAKAAAEFPDSDRGLDDFLAKLPSKALQLPRLSVEPVQINLGQLAMGRDRRFDLRLHNEGMRLVYGTVSCVDCIWLAVGDAPGGPRKLFQFADSSSVPVHIIGKRLRAGNKALEGRLLIESNGGTQTVVVHAEVPVKAFVGGVLAGAVSPRQIAEKAKASPREASILFEQGAVEQWYVDNGWTYPVQGPAASGISGIQQFFEALGLTTPPRVDISERAVTFEGGVGERLERSIRVETPEKRPVYAHAVADQPWMRIGPVALEGRSARIPIEVPSVPARPGERLHGRVTVTANGNQRFWVDVNLFVTARPTAVRSTTSTIRTGIPVAQPAPVAQAIAPIPYAVAAAPTAVILEPDSPARLAELMTEPYSGSKWLHAVPVMLLFLVLLGVVARDMLLPPRTEEAAAAEVPIDPNPYIEVRFHDGKKGDDADRALPDPTMRFGLMMPREKDPAVPDKMKRLTYDEFGRTNNTCLRIDGSEYLFGSLGSRSGKWIQLQEKSKAGGTESVWELPYKKIAVRQIVEVVAGEPSRRLDTCRVRYVIENRDHSDHSVGIRFMLDTFIGANDGVPFMIPGRSDLCDTKMEFTSKEDVPDFIQALEREDLRNPGTIAHIQFKLGGRVESPDRVTLGAWPQGDFRKFGIPQAFAQETGWDVPFLEIRRLDELLSARGERADPDSAVVMYWNERPLEPGEQREVGFTYGLGTVASTEGGGRLALTIGGRLVARGEFTLTALVHEPKPDEQLTLTLPSGFSLVEGTETQPVPPLPENSSQHNSPVTWRIKAGGDGSYKLSVKSNEGAVQSQPIRIRTKGVFD